MACDESTSPNIVDVYLVYLTWRSFNKLINIEKNYRVLYDVTLNEFKNTTTKNNAWSEISREVGVNGRPTYLAQ